MSENGWLQCLYCNNISQYHWNDWINAALMSIHLLSEILKVIAAKLVNGSVCCFIHYLWLACVHRNALSDVQRVKGVTASLGVPFPTVLQFNRANDKTLSRWIHFRKKCQLIKRRREEGITLFIFLLFFPFRVSFSAGEVMIAVFPLESCHHSRSNSL